MLPMVRVATYICRECGFESYQRVLLSFLIE